MDNQLKTLVDAFLHAKQQEADARFTRLHIEKEILTLLPKRNSPGAVDLDDLSVVFKDIRRWNQMRLNVLAEEIADEYWPFKREWKEDRRASRVYEGKFPELWARISSALELRPAKPSFIVKDKERSRAPQANGEGEGDA